MSSLKYNKEYECHEWRYNSTDYINATTRWGTTWNTPLYKLKISQNSYNSAPRKFSVSLWFWSQNKKRYIGKRKFFPDRTDVDKWIETNVAKMKLNEL